jgi:hypothetical protein
MMISAGDILITIQACLGSKGVVFRIFFLSVIKFNLHFPWKANLKIGKLPGPASQNHVSILDFRTRRFAPSILHFTVDALHSPEV